MQIGFESGPQMNRMEADELWEKICVHPNHPRTITKLARPVNHPQIILMRADLDAKKFASIPIICELHHTNPHR